MAAVWEMDKLGKRQKAERPVRKYLQFSRKKEDEVLSEGRGRE